MTRHARVAESKTETKALIDDAKAAEDLKAQADIALATSQESANEAAVDLAEKNQAVYDDLTANGSALYIENSDSGDSYFIATPDHPAGYVLTPIRIA